MKKTDIIAWRLRLEMNHDTFGDFLGGYSGRQVYRWESGKSQIPPAIKTLHWLIWKCCGKPEMDWLETKIKQRNLK